MLQLRQFNLQLALGALRPAGKNIQNQADPVDHPAMHAPLQVAFLCGRQLMIEDDDIGFGGLNQGGDFVGLATADEQGGVRTTTLTLDLAQNLKPCALGQQPQFRQAFSKIGVAEIKRHQYDALTALVTLKQAGLPCYGSGSTYPD